MNGEQKETSDTDQTISVGNILRSSREQQGICLEEAAKVTKIGKNYLKALEEDRPQVLPGPAYLKAFLKIYATYLGLPEEQTNKLAFRYSQPLDKEPVSTSGNASIPRRRNWQRFFLPATLLAALLVSAFFIAPSSEPVRTNRYLVQKPSQAVQATVSSVSPQPVLSSVSIPVSIPEESQPQLAAQTEVVLPVAVSRPAASGFIITVKVRNNSSLSVNIDDSTTQGYELTSGDIVEWKADKTIALDLSDSDSIDIYLNGTPVDLKEVSGKNAYIVLDSNGIRH